MSDHDWRSGLSKDERTSIGVEVAHDLRCDHEGDRMERNRWNSLAMAKAMASLHKAEEERDKALALLTRLRNEPALLKAGGRGGQDQYAGQPPAYRLIDALIPRETL